MDNAQHLATVNGEKLTEKPKDLYIPPDALQVALEAFEGPLDLLLYLIKKHKLDILDISVLSITEQYMDYMELMKALKLELAAEYMLMAALLAQIKSRLLLPKHPELEEEDDPRAELIRRLQEYEQFKTAAEHIDEMPRVDRDIFLASAELPTETHQLYQSNGTLPQINLQDLVLAMTAVMKKADLMTHHQISRETLSTRERMSLIMNLLAQKNCINFSEAFSAKEGKAGAVVSFLACLELVKESLVELKVTECGESFYIYLISSR